MVILLLKIRLTPKQIATTYRKHIIEVLGWDLKKTNYELQKLYTLQ